MNIIMQEIKKYKKGIIVGTAMGVLFALYTQIKGINLMFAVEGRGGIDTVLSLPDPTMAFIKVLIVLVISGAVLGYSMDKLIRW